MLLVTLLALPARADDSPTTAQFKVSMSPEQISALMHTDGEGERLSMIPFATMGSATLLGGGLLLGTDNKIAQGAAWPLTTVGAIEVLAGIIFAVRAGPHLRHLDELLASDPK